MSRTASAMAETICPPHIEGRHPMLYFNIQRTEKYSIAMCKVHSSEATTDIVNLATDLVTAYAGDYRYDEYNDQTGYECDHGK